jgi:hypothetical protein
MSERGSELHRRGLSFGGRVLLLGPVGTDFEGFVYHLAVEVPVKLVSVQTGFVPSAPRDVIDLMRMAIESTRRNSPALLYIPGIDSLSSLSRHISWAVKSELERITWDEDETLVIASCTHPEALEPDIVTAFDRTVILESPSSADRESLMAHLLKGRTDLDVAVIAELTEGWSFADLRHLAASLFLSTSVEKTPMSRERIEELIGKSGVLPVGRSDLLREMKFTMAGRPTDRLRSLEDFYPDEFMDQLYLMAVTEDYIESQRVIESLNAGSMLTAGDRAFLIRYPFLLAGKPEDRLARLLRAKKNKDRLSRIMGR